MTLLTCSLIAFTIGVVGVQATARGTGAHDVMVAVSLLSVVGALLSLVLFECAPFWAGKREQPVRDAVPVEDPEPDTEFR